MKTAHKKRRTRRLIAHQENVSVEGAISLGEGPQIVKDSRNAINDAVSPTPRHKRNRGLERSE
jgi:hypothetical protein